MFVLCADNDPHDDLQPVPPQGSCAGCLAGAPEFCGSGEYNSFPATATIHNILRDTTDFCPARFIMLQRKFVPPATRQ